MLASSILLQPRAPFALPAILVLAPIIVHTIDPSASRAEVLREEREDLAPAVDRLLRAVCRPVVVEEPVTRAVVAVELVALPMLLELLLVTVDLLGRRRLVVVPE